MLGAIIPKEKKLVYNLRRRRCHLPQIKTERYKKTFVNRLNFKYNLVYRIYSTISRDPKL